MNEQVLISESQSTKSETDSSQPKKSRRCRFNCKSLVLLVALSTHAIFEGIALGLTKELNGTINIMMALLIHKSPEAISLGVSLSKNFKDAEAQKKAVRLLVVFALAAPIGVAIGMLLQEAHDLVEIIFSSFAGGTFIYIAASEVIVEEFSMGGPTRWAKLGFFLLGAIIITLMWLMEI